jgi:thiamine pyridinylase
MTQISHRFFGTGRRRLRGLLAFFLAFAVSVLTSGALRAENLVVGLYTDVPSVQRFEDVLRAGWAKVEPTVALTFLPASEWDGGYNMDPPDKVDVFVFDGMFFDYFKAKGYLEALAAGEIQNLGDFVAYAIDGVKAGDQYFSIPLLGCANILFYGKSDAEMAAATTLSKVNSALDQCSYTSQIPPDRRGLMVDLKGESQIDRQAMDNVKSLLSMASFYNATEEPPGAYGRAVWMSEGYGRAMIGFTEAMSQMTPETLAGIAFRVAPLSDVANRPLFYADVIGINTKAAERGKRALAVKLANLLAASETVVQSFSAGGRYGNPQYLMATRPSVFEKLGNEFPIYKDMYALLTTGDPVMFKLDDTARSWLASMKDTIRNDVRAGYSCACDQPASQTIPNNAAAAPICQATCAAHGGWNGQWSNDIPGTGGSVCGCKACPIP